MAARQISGFILAGGQSKRMGQDKALMDWKGRTLLDHVTALLSSVAHPVRVVGRGDLPDRLRGTGPLGGIETALSVSETDRILIVAVDYPLLTAEFFQYFKETFLASASPALACEIGSKIPLCLGLNTSTRTKAVLGLNSGDWSVYNFLQACNCEFIHPEDLAAHGFEESIFLNVNTIADYRAAYR